MLRRLFRKAEKPTTTPRIAPVLEDLSTAITPLSGFEYGVMPTTAAALVPTNSKRGVRSRQQIYDKWAVMESDPIVSTAIGLLVTAALGGHETTGQVIFIEATAAARQDKRLATMVAEISRDLSGLFSQVAYTLGYNVN